MRYGCPKCGSLRTPRTISYFPPKIYQCSACKFMAVEKDFIKDDKYHFPTVPQFGKHQ